MFKKINWWVILGAAAIAFGAVNMALDYKANALSPFDMVDEGSGGDDFLPIVSAANEVPVYAPTLGAVQSAVLGAVQGQPAGLETIAVLPPASGLVPERLVIPTIFLNAPIVPVHFREIEAGGQTYYQWRVPAEFAAGWQDTSALAGVPGNMVLNGHHNAYGEVFRDLVELKVGDVIQVFSGEWEYRYVVSAKMLLPERNQPLDVRMDNARWLEPSTDERLTLITCWPASSNSHRVIIVALPEGEPIHHPTVRAANP
ncbi:MAG: sortase [Anaerolineales bacterium]|nr:sortase [Anaerolineales bacterium]